MGYTNDGLDPIYLSSKVGHSPGINQGLDTAGLLLGCTCAGMSTVQGQVSLIIGDPVDSRAPSRIAWNWRQYGVV